MKHPKPCRLHDACPLSEFRMRVGEVYLFHRTDPRCRANESLWAVFDKRIDERIYLESSSFNLRDFRRWHALPEGYRYCRLATRSELRDYTAGLIMAEERRLGGGR